MQVEQFRSGQWLQQYQYKSFSPTPINCEWQWLDPQLNTLLERASRALAELNALSLMVPDVDLFIRMHIAKEANTSSRIEGTQTQMDEALMRREQVAPEKRDDWQEVQNYIEAINTAVDDLKQLPLSIRVLKQTHAVLMQGVRGDHKMPGEFRTSQNWIGGSNLNNAVFVPPHPNEVPELMGDLEKFWHNEQVQVPDLIRIALSHYQFETIHPFLDGNGRIGRLLITLYLVDKGLLHKPALYLSDFFERNRGAYYDALTVVRSSNDLLHWLRFFLTAVVETATSSKNTFMAIMTLRHEVEHQILSLGKRAENAKKLLLHLYQRPMVSIGDVSEILDVTHPSAAALVKQLESLDILVETTGYGRNRLYLFQRYFDLFMA
ncbi:filamentation induced by cAMP protein fic [Pseudomonas sp. BAY1663]|uniref:Protein adenylyltransferase n=1 Tax=Stutzerimonas stutzeri TaxID=316 RepID=A0A2N8T4E6_STUST|nr:MULTISPECIES: Fic family protein [Pseudomonadaceae]EXF43463.1 filamentation induced by cAMP protein fic [Pseudomonas sp. BAY1663]MCQ4324146.1 Fic family protein [Stutzerimonas stutzeri]PNG09610.1 Fic family protein [Stutzerimonas stutzeri]